jgi:hypothetical protein
MPASRGAHPRRDPARRPKSALPDFRHDFRQVAAGPERTLASAVKTRNIPHFV